MPDAGNAPRVVVIGGGFAGLNVVRGLRRAPVAVTLIDQHNYHLFQPLLYQVATASLSPADIAQPIRRIFRHQPNVEVLLAEVESIDLPGGHVIHDHGVVPFDVLVIATGATHSYFGHPQWQDAAPGLKTIDDALEIRRRMLLAFEEAEQEADDASRRAKLTFVVVGGGPTGVELAGAMKEIAAQSIPRDFRHIDTTTTRVILVEAADRLLRSMPADLSARARRDLERMGVEVRLNTLVTALDRRGVIIGGELLPAENVLWAAGVQASPLARSLGVPLDRSGRVPVAPDLTVPGHPNVFVAGDLASVTDPRTGQPVPGIAPAAIQMGRYIARAIRHPATAPARPPAPARPSAALETPPNPPRPAFTYYDKGMLATIGKARAVGVVAGRHCAGLPAWLLWSLVHILFLIGFRNKLFVMLGWIWAYAMSTKGARLITGSPAVRIKQSRTASPPSDPDARGRAE